MKHSNYKNERKTIKILGHFVLPVQHALPSKYLSESHPKHLL